MGPTLNDRNIARVFGEQSVANNLIIRLQHSQNFQTVQRNSSTNAKKN